MNLRSGVFTFHKSNLFPNLVNFQSKRKVDVRSVNVFLGLGLPWVIRTIYYAVNGGTYEVDTSGLQFCVALFDSFGAVCVLCLILRYDN